MISFDYCVYPLLAERLEDMECTRKEFADAVGISASNAYWWMTGNNERTLNVIRRVLEMTGLRFEEAFLREEI